MAGDSNLFVPLPEIAVKYTCFDVTIESRIAHIVLNRPDKRNSMIPAFRDELPAIIEDIDGNAKARVIVISSTGPHFSGGLDVSAFGGGDAPSNPDDSVRRQHGAQFYDNVLHMQQTLRHSNNVEFRCSPPFKVVVSAAASIS